MSILKSFLDIILPPRCLGCGAVLQEDKGLCDSCFNQLSFITKPYCYRCGSPIYVESSGNAKIYCGKCLHKKQHLFKRIRSSFAYDEASKRLILNFKFHDKTENAKFLAQTMYVAGDDVFSEGVDLLIPVPLHYFRLLGRGYNQSVLLCKELSKLSDVNYDYKSLVKCRRTRPQVELSGRDRLKNVKGSFLVKYPNNIKGKRILLIDDVLTTGSTLKECGLMLKKAGAKSVSAITVARVL